MNVYPTISQHAMYMHKQTRCIYHRLLRMKKKFPSSLLFRSRSPTKQTDERLLTYTSSTTGDACGIYRLNISGRVLGITQHVIRYTVDVLHDAINKKAYMAWRDQASLYLIYDAMPSSISRTEEIAISFKKTLPASPNSSMNPFFPLALSLL